MARAIVSSDSESDRDSESTPVKVTASKTSRAAATLPRLDLNTVTAGKTSTRSRQSSAKVKENGQRAEAGKDALIADLKKQLKNSRQKHEKTKAQLRERDVERTPPESEEEDDRVEMSAFSNSFISRGVVANTAAKPVPKKLRKSGDEVVPTPMSRAALTTLDDNVIDAEQASAVEDEVDPPPPPPSSSPRSSPRRKRVHGSSPPRHRSVSPNKRPRKRTKTAAAEPPLTKAEFIAGKAPGGARTNLKDFTEPARKLIKNAQHAYEVRIWTINAFPPSEMQSMWVGEIWDEVNEAAGERMELTERISRMIKSYASHARSTLKDGVRPLVGPTYLFEPGDNDKEVRKNIKIVKALLDSSAFHYEDPKELKGYMRNSIIKGSLRAVFFKSKTGRGVTYSQYFSPISLVTLALIFTAIEFCITEYESGRFQQAVFDEVANKERYDVHLHDLTEWASLKPSVTTVVRQQMHDSCRSLAGAAPIKLAGRLTEQNRARALAELEAMEADEALGNAADDAADDDTVTPSGDSQAAPVG